MEDLNKTQLILLALLVSFVTSIATGIVTVTLLDQAPPGVTQTINRVVRETVKIVVPQESQSTSITQTIVVKEEDFIVEAAQKNSGNVVRIGSLKKKGFTLRTIGGDDTDAPPEIEFIGTGFVVSSGGLVVTLNVPAEDSARLVAQTLADDIFEVEVVHRDEDWGIALLQILEEDEILAKEYFASIEFADSDATRIGQTAIALGVNNGLLLLLGVVSRLDVAESSIKDEAEKEKIVVIYTTIETDGKYSGGPLLNTDAHVMGINVVTSEKERFTIPANIIQEILSGYKGPKEEGAPSALQDDKQSNQASALLD